jgi:hypothetical protein
MWALFKDEKQISKAHPTKDAAETEAFEHHAVLRSARPFGSIYLAPGYSVREVWE